MPKRDFTMTSKILMSLLILGDKVLVTPRELRSRVQQGDLLKNSNGLLKILFYLHKKGFIRYVNKHNEKFISLTKNGQLEALMLQSRLPAKTNHWDGKWRMILFDIPEESKEKRQQFRSLLKLHGYKKFQHSVYINPWPLHRDAIEYLKSTGLIDYIRIVKVEEIDKEEDLLKFFQLKR